MSEIQLPHNPVPAELQPLLHVNDPVKGVITVFRGADTSNAFLRGVLTEAGAANDVMWDTEVRTPSGLDWVRFTVPDRGNLTRMAIVSDTAQNLVFFGMLLPSNSPDALKASVALYNKIADERGRVFEKAIRRCHLILSEVDLYDDESKAKAKDRLADIFSVFSSMSEALLQELSKDFLEDTNIIGFLLMDVLISADDMQTQSKIDIISGYTANPQASIRYEAVRALDYFNAANIRPLLENIYTGETNPEVKGLLEASLRTAL